MRRKKADAVEDFPERLSSGVTVIVRTTAAIYDTLTVQKAGGIVTVALPSAQFGAMPHVSAPSGAYVPPAGSPNVEAARAALHQQFPDGPVATSPPPPRDIVSPASLGLPSAEELGLLGGSGEGFTGRSNEDTDA